MIAAAAFWWLCGYGTASQTSVLDKNFAAKSLDYISSTNWNLSMSLSRIYERKNLYMPIVREFLPKFKAIGFEFSEENLLNKIVSLENIESEGDLSAVSKSGAEGPYQLMPGTSRDYGLKNNDYVNESFNPEKAARVALGYILDYAKIYRSMDMALLAYNAGPGKVDEILKKYPSVKYEHEFPKEMLNVESACYVHRINALYEKLQNPEKYGLMVNAQELKFERHTVNPKDTLEKIAMHYHSSEDMIKGYNGLKGNALPMNYALTIPKKY